MMGEDLAFDGAEAAELPFVGDEVVHEAALFGSGGGEAVVIIAGEGFEFGGVLEREHGFGFGVDAGFEGVLAGDGFALGGAGSGGFLCVAAVGGYLFIGRHQLGPFRAHGSSRVGGNPGVGLVSD